MSPDVAAFLATLPEFRAEHPRQLKALAERCEVWSFREGDLIRFADEEPDGRLWVGEGCLAAARSEEPPRYIGVREEADVGLGYWLRGQTAGWYVKLPERLAPAEPDTVFRQSPMLPILRSVVPVFFAALFAVLGGVLMALGTSVPLWALWLLPGAGMAASSGWTALIIHEWWRSFVILRGRRLELSWLDVGAREAWVETLSADRIREAVVSRQGFWGFWGLVTLEIETDVPGGPGARFRFSGLPSHTGVGEALAALPKPQPPAHVQQAWAAKAGRAPVLVAAPLPPPELRFRRHWWFLLGKLLPWLGWTALAAFVASWAGLWAALWAVGAVLVVLPLAGAVWEIWDWSNDTFRVTDTQVLTVKRRPLWLGEVRQEAPLELVEQLGVLRTGLAALVLDFATVTVRLGPADPIEFSGLARPEAVRQAVLERRGQFHAERERQAASSRFNEVADIIETWDKAQRSGYLGVKP